MPNNRVDKTDISEKLLRLKELIGQTQLNALLAEFGGSNLYIPKSDAFMRILRDEEIKADHNYNNLSIIDLRKKYKLSENQVRRILFTKKKYR